MGLGDLHHTPAALLLGTDSLPSAQEAACALILVWAGMEHLLPLGVQTPDNPASNGTLY